MSAVLNPSVASTPWRLSLAALGLVLLGILLLFRDTFAAMGDIWSRSETFAHAWLVPPIVLWLAWRRRTALALFTPAPQPWMIVPMAFIAAAWLVGDTAGVNALTQLCVTALLVMAVPAVLGLPVARQLTFPLVFLFFMVPIGEFLLPVMMEATADFTVAAVALSGVPVYREGLQFIIPTGAWSVVEACSGVRYLIASFMVGTLFAYLNYTSPWRRWAFAGVSILVPILANWLRAYMIVMLGHLSGNRLAVGVDHLIYGWVFFGVVIGIMFFVGSRWAEREAPPPTPPARPAGQRDPSMAFTWAVSAAALAVLALPQAAAWQLAHPPALPSLVLTLPELPATQAVPDKPLIMPIAPGAAAQASRVYQAGDGAVTVHIAYFRQQGYGAKLASGENMFIRNDDKFWNRLSTAQATVDVKGIGPLTMRSSQLIGGGTGNSTGRQRLAVREFYWSGGRFTASDKVATLLGVLGRLTGQGDDGAVISIYAEGEPDSTQPRLDTFIGSHLAVLQAQLNSARRPR